MYEGIYLDCIRSICIFVDILTVCSFIFFNIKYEYNITVCSTVWKQNTYLKSYNFVLQSIDETRLFLK